MSPEELAKFAADARPRMKWRIGVSGHIDLSATSPVELQVALERVFADIAAALRTVKGRADASSVFADGEPLIAVVSPLAEGSDRFFANLAMKLGFELRVPLPLPPAEYKKDFKQGVENFDSLLAYAKTSGGAVIELDGRYANEDERNEAYMAAGEFVVRNCDLLVAIWDGKEARGHGGTGQVVPYAKKCGLPIVHIDSTGPDNVSLFDPVEGFWKAHGPKEVAAVIDAQMFPKVRPARRHGHHPPESADDDLKAPSLTPAHRYFRAEHLSTTGTMPNFLGAGPYVANVPSLHGLSRLFPLFVKLLGNASDGPEVAAVDPPYGVSDTSDRYLYLHHHRADVLASFYANVHRSVFMMVYALGALALSFAVAALYFPKSVYLFTGLELAVLLLLAVLVFADNRFRWRDRWLEYRLLAEMLREADLLGQIGRPMPIVRIGELAQDLPGRAWVAVAYCAIVRSAGIVSRSFDAAFLSKMRDYAAGTRLEDQIVYHRKTAKRAESIAGALRTVALAAFIGTVLAAVLKLSWHESQYFAVGLLAGVLPAFAYACFGIRNQAEFEIVSRRSERMVSKLKRHQKNIRALEGKWLTSETLGREILQAAAVMRHDAADWGSIFEVKETETN